MSDGPVKLSRRHRHAMLRGEVDSLYMCAVFPGEEIPKHLPPLVRMRLMKLRAQEEEKSKSGNP
ncbi:MAG TPA: hypothetical protein VJX91_00150 [Candidatus Eisenbacteria bacterium]|nr:hypothetical protein [Candidatus Eisenbacteria bacterium]